MSERREVIAGPIDERDLCKIKEAICMQVEKVYDSCKEKDCIEDIEVFGICKNLIKSAIDASCREVEVEDVIIDVEPLKFKRGFYTVTVTFVFKVEVELFFKNKAPKTRCGVAIFTKKVVLFGSQGRVKIFKSKFRRGKPDIQYTPKLEQDNRPNGKVEVAEPICLAAKIEEECEATILSARDIDIIKSILSLIQSNIAVVDVDAKDNADVDIDIDQTNIVNIGGGGKPEKKLLVTIGIFSIIKLVRFVQVLVPAFGFCNPPFCVEATKEKPCEFFNTISFPKEAFFPPQRDEWEEELGEEGHHHRCGE